MKSYGSRRRSEKGYGAPGHATPKRRHETRQEPAQLKVNRKRARREKIERDE